MVGFEQPIPKYVKPQKTTSGDFDFTEVDDMLSRDYVQGSIIQMVRNITPVGTSAQQVIPTDGTDLLAINTDGSINVVSVGKALSTAVNGTVANNNTQTIFTAGANGAKVYAYGLSSAGTAAGDITLTIKGTVALKITTIAGVAGNHEMIKDVTLGANYILLTSGQTVTVTSPSVNIWAYGNIVYENL